MPGKPALVHHPRRRTAAPADGSTPSAWLDVARVARVEASSYDAQHPVGDAFVPNGSGWRASEPGEQVVRVVFRSPRSIRRVRVVFKDAAAHRTQEFTLSWSSHRGETHREMVRQQFNFSPRGATQEVEEYEVELQDVTWLELRIVPDIQGGDALASVAEFKIA
jgi:hypothetical protein